MSVGAGSAEPASWRRWVGAAVGAVIIGVPAARLPASTSDGCGTSCAAALSAAIGGWIGHVLGQELDEKARREWEAEPKLAVRLQPAPPESRDDGCPVANGSPPVPGAATGPVEGEPAPDCDANPILFERSCCR